jgi:hypothetical protein
VKVRFVRAWQWYRVGDVITPPALLRGWLVARKFCTPVVEPPKRGYRVSRENEVEATSGEMFEIAVAADKPVRLASVTPVDIEMKDPVPADPPRQSRARRPRGDL